MIAGEARRVGTQDGVNTPDGTHLPHHRFEVDHAERRGRVERKAEVDCRPRECSRRKGKIYKVRGVTYNSELVLVGCEDDPHPTDVGRSRARPTYVC